MDVCASVCVRIWECVMSMFVRVFVRVFVVTMGRGGVLAIGALSFV